MRVTIGKKLMLGYLIVILLMIALTLYAINVSQRFLEESVGKNSIFLAEEMLKRINYSLQHIVEHVHLHTHDLLLRKMISRSNRTFQDLENIPAYIEQKDAEWIAAPDKTITPFMQELISNELSDQLREKFIEFWEDQLGYPLFAEVFVTNNYGVNVAQTNKTSDYYQADEAWWQIAKENGYYIGAVEYNEIAQAFIIPTAVKVEDEAGNVIGVIKAAVSITAVVREAKIAARTYKTTEIQVISAQKKQLIYATRVFQFLEDISDKAFFKHLQGESGFFVAEEGNRKKLFSYIHSKEVERYQGIDWILLMRHDEREVLTPMYSLRNNIIIISVILTVTGIFIAFLTSRSITLPIGDLIKGTKIIEKGDLTYRVESRTNDELGELAVAFNQMTAKRQQAVEELKKHHEHLEELVEERTAELKRTNEALQREIVERQQAEEALKESEQRLSTTLMSIGDAVIATDARGIVTLMNPVAEDLTGWAEAEAVSKPLEDAFNIVNEKTGEQVENPVARVLREGLVVGLANDTVLIARDGTRRAIADSGAPMRDEEGNIIGTVMVFRDITEQKKAEEERARVRSYLTSSLSSTPDGVLLLDEEARFTYVNPAFLRWLGREAEAFIGKTNREISPPIMTPEATETIAKRAQRRVKTGEAIVGAEVEIIDKDGKPMPISYSAAGIKDDQGNVLGEVVFIKDMTALKRTEEALRESEERYRSLYESSKDGIGYADMQGNFRGVNQAFLDLLGYTEEEFKKLSYQDLTPDRWAKMEEDLVKTQIMPRGYSDEYEKEYIRKDGSIVPVTIRVWLIKDEKGNPMGMWALVRDITEAKKAETELKQHREHLEELVEERTRELRDAQERLVASEKLAAIGQLASGVGHELRNPLGVIGNSAYYLNTKLKDADEKVVKHVGIVRREVQRANHIITDLLDFSRVRPPSFEEGDLNRIIRDTLAEINIPANISVETRLDEKLPAILVDPDRIRRVCLNIISNALQVMPEGGRLEVTTGVKGGVAEITFKDTGEGIPEEHLQKVFEPLFTTKAKGIGLGLAIVKGIIDSHKGRIEVESKVSEGTTFTVKLPLQKKKK